MSDKEWNEWREGSESWRDLQEKISIAYYEVFSATKELALATKIDETRSELFKIMSDLIQSANERSTNPQLIEIMESELRRLLTGY